MPTQQTHTRPLSVSRTIRGPRLIPKLRTHRLRIVRRTETRSRTTHQRRKTQFVAKHTRQAPISQVHTATPELPLSAPARASSHKKIRPSPFNTSPNRHSSSQHRGALLSPGFDRAYNYRAASSGSDHSLANVAGLPRFVSRHHRRLVDTTPQPNFLHEPPGAIWHEESYRKH